MNITKKQSSVVQSNGSLLNLMKIPFFDIKKCFYQNMQKVLYVWVFGFTKDKYLCKQPFCGILHWVPATINLHWIYAYQNM